MFCSELQTTVRTLQFVFFNSSTPYTRVARTTCCMFLLRVSPWLAFTARPAPGTDPNGLRARPRSSPKGFAAPGSFPLDHLQVSESCRLAAVSTFHLFPTSDLSGLGLSANEHSLCGNVSDGIVQITKTDESALSIPGVDQLNLSPVLPPGVFLLAPFARPWDNRAARESLEHRRS